MFHPIEAFRRKKECHYLFLVLFCNLSGQCTHFAKTNLLLSASFMAELLLISNSQVFFPWIISVNGVGGKVVFYI
jgi:hypothetical protein